MKKECRLMVTVVLWLAVLLPLAPAATWTGNAGDRDWFNTNNWNPLSVPGEGTHVSVPVGADVLITNETAELASFSMAGGTVTFSNWFTRLRADTVEINGGTLTLPPAFTEIQESNRVWIVCEDFTLAEGAEIDAHGLGYVVEQGEGKGDSRGGAGHGGLGGAGSSTSWADLGKVYGNPAFPLAPGSGGGATTATGTGGGAVRIQASGAVTINGTISVRGNTTSSNGGAGSGGSILIECLTFHGAATGLLNASGGNGTVSGGRAGGGRIAVIYDTDAQALLAEPNPPVRFQAAPGTGGSGNGTYTVRPGTLYLPDDQFLSSNMSAERWLNVVLVIPDFTTWNLTSLTLGGKIAFQDLETILVAGDFTLTNGGALTLFGEPAHPEVTGAGQLLKVGGTLTIQNTAGLHLYANDLSGVAPYVECGRVDVQAGGAISGDGYGYAMATGDGAGTERSSGGYGGRGRDGLSGEGGAPYGVAHAPVEPGSGGGESLSGGGRGGGIVRVSARGVMRVDGTISANGMSRLTAGNYGAGSGGGILLSAQSFKGSETGLLRANGATTSYAAGGGRIAVWTPFMPYTFVQEMATRENPPVAALQIDPDDWFGWMGDTSVTGYEAGTVFFGQIPVGTLFKMR